MIHEIIYQIHPDAVSIINDIPYNSDGKQITIDMDAYNNLVDSVISEQKLKRLRDERNKRISQSDWMANSDVTMSEEWRTYRQALRDITNTYTSLDDVVWPEKPE